MTRTADSIIVLGAGLAGLTVATELAKKYGSRIVLIEKEAYVGGLAASHTVHGWTVDIGSHRIQGSFSRRIFHYLRDTLALSLLKRPRHGALFIHNTYLRYPPTFINLFRKLHPLTMAQYAVSYLYRFRYPKQWDTYESGMLRWVGKKIYYDLFHDFAQKLWGIEPTELSLSAGKRRKALFDFKALVANTLGTNSYFYYPRNGIGSIAATLKEHFTQYGGRCLLNTRLCAIRTTDRHIATVTTQNESGTYTDHSAELCIATIPIDELYTLLAGSLPATKKPLAWRSLRVIYLLLDRPLPHRHETFYFPTLQTFLGRVSDISKYAPVADNHNGQTLLTIEIPLAENEQLWHIPDDTLAIQCLEELKKLRLIDRHTHMIDFASSKYTKAYPIYTLSWDDTFTHMLATANTYVNLFTIGRKGLFLHNNIDHSMAQGLDLAAFITKGNDHDASSWHKKVTHYLTCTARD